MEKMTEEEAEYWDEYFTKNTPKLGPNGTGFISQRALYAIGMDHLSVTYLVTRALATNRSVGSLINDMVHRDIYANVEKTNAEEETAGVELLA